MRRLLKYLKPYLVPIILALSLLFIQANAELALPDYLSRIVNNGIQQNGVENAVAEAFRQTTLERLTLFMDPEDADVVLDSYQLVKPDASNVDDYLEDYPLLEEESIYVLQEIDSSREEQLNGILGKSLLAYSAIQRFIEDPTAVPMMGEGFDFDPAMIPPRYGYFPDAGIFTFRPADDDSVPDGGSVYCPG